MPVTTRDEAPCGQSLPVDQDIAGCRLETSGVGPSSDVDYEIMFEVHDILGNDEHVVVLGDAHGTRAGKTLDYRVAEIYHLRDGKIVERWAFSDDTAAITAFFA